MPHLPFLVLHGALVWKLVLVGLVAGTFGVVSWPLGTRRAVLAAALSVPLWYGVLHTVGQHIETRAISVSELAPFGKVSIAAALPGSRAAALHALMEGTAQGLTHDDAGLRRGMELDRWSGECSARRLWDAKRIEEALVAAQDCDPLLVPRLLAATGKYEEAARSIAPGLDDELALASYIATSRWADAATVVRNGVWRAPQQVWAGCLAGFLSSRTGDRDALATLGGERSPPCRLLYAVATGTLEPSWTYGDFAVARLAVALGSPERAWEQFLYADRDDAILPWLARFAVTSSVDDARAQYFEDGRALRDLLVGDWTAARAELASPRSKEGFDRMRSRHDARSRLAIAEGTELPSFEAPLELDILPRGERLLRGDMTALGDSGLVVDERCGRATAVRAALSGDGGPLSVLLEVCRSEWWPPVPEIARAILGRVVTHRAELAAELRQVRGDLDGSRPFEAVAEYATYRDISRAIGDADEANRWQVTVDRFARMLTDRDRATAFAILETMRDVI